jgi:hypothetical protein
MMSPPAARRRRPLRALGLGLVAIATAIPLMIAVLVSIAGSRSR